MKVNLLIFLLLIVASCNQQMSDEDRKVGIRDFKNQEVKRVNKAEILAAGLEKGQLVASKSQTILINHLSQAVNESGTEEALSFCNINAYPLIDSISSSFGVTIRRVSTRYRNNKDAPDSLEALLLDAYAYNVENGYPLKDNIQQYDAENLIYTMPISAGSSMCLKCHGKEVDGSVRERIAQLYPDDKALNHELNDLRGMWSVKIPVKDIVNGLE